jgi:hypothetical protein
MEKWRVMRQRWERETGRNIEMCVLNCLLLALRRQIDGEVESDETEVGEGNWEKYRNVCTELFVVGVMETDSWGSGE